MIELLFKYAESAVAPSNALLSFLLAILIALMMGAVTKRIFDSIKHALISSVLTMLVLIILYYAVRNEVADFRLASIESTMAKLQPVESGCTENTGVISSWRQGLSKIERCPSESGFYEKTADLLMEEGDYRSAATLIEFGLNFVPVSPFPAPLCERLIKCYALLDSRPTLDERCGTFQQLR